MSRPPGGKPISPARYAALGKRDWELRLLRAWGFSVGAEAELQFAPPRRWRFDWAWLDWKVALEIEGGAWSRGRHTRGKGFLGDIEKYNAAAARGWTVLRTTPEGFNAGTFADDLEATLKRKGWERK